MAKQTVSARVDQGQLNDLIEQLGLFGEDVKNAVADEIELAGLMIESDAKRNCPVKTGRLRASIISLTDRAKLSTVVGTNVSYAQAVEFGGTNRVAKPFLYPAYFENVSKLMKRLIDIKNA